MNSSDQPLENPVGNQGTPAQEEGLPNGPIPLAAAMCTQFAGVGSLMPFLPLYFSMLGVSASGIALILSVQAATVLLIAQVWGYLSDQFVSRTRLMLFLSLGAATVQALYPYIPGEVLLLSAGMFFHELFFGPRVALINALALASRRGEEIFGRVRIAGSVSFAVTTVLLGWIADLPGSSVAIMWPALVGLELLFSLSITRLKDRSPAERLGQGQPRLNFRQAQTALVGNRLIRRFLIYIFLFQAFHFPGLILQIRLMDALGASNLFIMACMSLAAVVEIAVFFFGHQILGRIRLMPLLALIPAAIALRWGIIFLRPELWWILASNTLHLITFGLSYLVCVVFMNREAPYHLRSSGQTLLGIVFSSLAMVFGYVFAAVVLGVLRDEQYFGMSEVESLRWFFGICGGLTLISFLAWFPLKSEYIRRHQLSGFWVRPAA